MSSPPTEHLAPLHIGVTNGDAAAADALTRLVLALLPGRVHRVSRGLPQEVVRGSVTDSLLDYLKQQNRFDTSHGVPLDRFLQLAAERNVRDWLRKEARRQVRERKASEEATRQPWTPNPAPTLPRQAMENVVRAVSDNVEWPAAQAWLAGERRTSAFAVYAARGRDGDCFEPSAV